MEKLIDKYNIKKKGELYSFECIAKNVIQTTNYSEYRKKTRQKYDDVNEYIEFDLMMKIINKSTSSIAKEFMKAYKKLTMLSKVKTSKTLDSGTENIDNLCMVEPQSGVFIFMGTPVDIILDKDNNPWFVGSEIARLLEYIDVDQALRKNIDNDCKNTKTQLFSRGFIPVSRTGITPLEKLKDNHILINESGLYSLIFNSKKKEAIKFQR